jgi:hypothetical protein
VEVADHGDVDAALVELVADVRHRAAAASRIDGDAHESPTRRAPASATWFDGRAPMSAVSVLVIDWTTTGAPPPIAIPADHDAAWNSCEPCPPGLRQRG